MGQRGGDAGRPLLIGAVVIGLLVLVAVAMPDGAVLFGDTDTDRVVMPDLPLIGEFLLVALWIGLVIAWLILRTRMLPARGFGIQREQKSRWPFWVGLGIFLIVWVLSPSVRDGLSELFDRANPFNDRPATGGAAQDRRAEVEGSRSLGWVVTMGLAAAFAFLIVTFARMARRRGVVPITPQQRLAEEIDASIDDLYAIGDPRSAVIASFARMQKLAAAAGSAQDPSETPFEFVARMLVEHDVSSAAAHRLTELYERARFSEHDVDEGMRMDALSALTDVKRELMGAPV